MLHLQKNKQKALTLLRELGLIQAYLAGKNWTPDMQIVKRDKIEKERESRARDLQEGEKNDNPMILYSMF